MKTLHRIDELVFDLSFESMAFAREQQPGLNLWVSTQVLPTLDELFDEYVGGDRVMYIDTLELDLGSVSPANYKTEIPQRLEEQLGALLRSNSLHLSSKSASALPAAEVAASTFKQLETFLLSGKIPALSDNSKSDLHEQLLDEALRQQSPQLLALLRQPAQQKAVLQRLTKQFSQPHLVRLLRQIAPQHMGWILDLLDVVELMPLAIGNRSKTEQLASVWEQVLEVLLRDPAASPQELATAVITKSSKILGQTPQQLSAAVSRLGEDSALLQLIKMEDESSSPVATAELESSASTQITEKAAASKTSLNDVETLADDGVDQTPVITAANQDLSSRLADAKPEQLQEICRQLQNQEIQLPSFGLSGSDLQRLISTFITLNPEINPAHRDDLFAAIQSFAQQTSQTEAYYRAVVLRLMRGESLDLEAIIAELAGQQNAESAVGTPSDEQRVVQADAGSPILDLINSGTPEQLRRLGQQLQSGEVQLPKQGLSSNHLQRVISALIELNPATNPANRSDLAAAIQSFAQQTRHSTAFLREVALHLLAGKSVDLEAILARVNEVSTEKAGQPEAAALKGRTQGQASESTADETGSNTSQTTPLTLRHALAEALLKADFQSIAKYWATLITQQRDLLRQALLHYSIRPEVRQQLMARFPLDALLDISDVLEPQASRLLKALFPHAELLRQIEPPHRSDSAEGWQRQLWETSFQQLLQHRNSPFDRAAHILALIHHNAGAELRTQQAVQRLWADILENEQIADSGNVPAGQESRTVESTEPRVDALKTLRHRLLGGRDDQSFPATPLDQLLDRVAIQNPVELSELYQQLQAAPERLQALKLRVQEWRALIQGYLQSTAAFKPTARQQVFEAIQSQAEYATQTAEYYRLVLQRLLRQQDLDLDAIVEESTQKTVTIDDVSWATISSASAEQLAVLCQQLQANEIQLPAQGLSSTDLQRLISTLIEVDGLVNPANRSDLLAAIDTFAQQAPQLGHYYTEVALRLIHRESLDLEAIVAGESAAAVSAELPVQESAPPSLSTNGRVETDSPKFDLLSVIRSGTPEQVQAVCRQLQTGLITLPEHGLNLAELQRVIGGLLTLNPEINPANRDDLLAAIQSFAAQAKQVNAYYTKIANHVIRREILDFEAIIARVNGLSLDASSASAAPSQTVQRKKVELSASVPDAEIANPSVETQKIQAQTTEALITPLSLRHALAEALLKADPTPIENLWATLVSEHRDLLRQALLHYGTRPEVRQQLMARFPLPMLLDFSDIFQPSVSRLLKALYPHAELLRQIEPPHTSENAEGWQRQLWETSFKLLLSDSHFDLEEHIQTLIRHNAGVEVRIRQALQRLWAEILDAERQVEALQLQEQSVETAAPASVQGLVDDLWRRLLKGNAPLPAQQTPPTTLPDLLQQLQQQAPTQLQAIYQRWQNTPADLQSLTLSAEEWPSLVQTYIQIDPAFEPAARTLVWDAIQAQAEQAAQTERYYRLVLQHLLDQQGLDLEAILEESEQVEPDSTSSDLAALVAADQKSEPATTAALSPEQAQTELQLVQLLQLPTLNSTQQTRLQALFERLLGLKSADLQGYLIGALGETQVVSRLVALVPESVLNRLLALLRESIHAPLLRCANIVVDALNLMVQGLGAERISNIKWRLIFEYLFVEKHEFTPQDFVRVLTEAMAKHGQVSDVSTLRNLVQRRLALLLPEASGVRANPNAAANTVEASAKTAAQEDPKLDEGVPLLNAGMVLAAPYLPRLFSMLKLTVDGRFVDFYAAERAVHLLQFMVNGHTESAEYQLLLNKLICGIGTSIPISPDIVLSENEKSITEQLLQGMIQNWSTIGKTSISGLRETFLQRPGWISLQEDAWQLKVQTGTFDMLLDRLPWSFSIIKYAWMDKPVHVTWR